MIYRCVFCKDSHFSFILIAVKFYMDKGSKTVLVDQCVKYLVSTPGVGNLHGI